MKRLCLATVLAFVFTASPLGAQGFQAGGFLKLVRWSGYTTFHTEWASAVGMTLQGLEMDANRRIDVCYLICCDIGRLQISALYARMFNEDAYGSVGPSVSYLHYDGAHGWLMGVEAGAGVELHRSEARVIASEFGYSFTFPYILDSQFGFENSDTVHGLAVRLIYRR